MSGRGRSWANGELPPAFTAYSLWLAVGSSQFGSPQSQSTIAKRRALLEARLFGVTLHWILKVKLVVAVGIVAEAEFWPVTVTV